MRAGRVGHEGGDPVLPPTPSPPLGTVDTAELVRLRAHRPEAIAEAAARRPRRPSWATTGG